MELVVVVVVVEVEDALGAIPVLVVLLGALVGGGEGDEVGSAVVEDDKEVWNAVMPQFGLSLAFGQLRRVGVRASLVTFINSVAYSD